MIQPSTTPIPGGKKVVNEGFGNRCILCGGYFDEGGICNGGHEKGHTYYYPPETLKVERPDKASATNEIPVTCTAYSGCRCNVCHGFFADGDDICGNGHEIGKVYIITVG